MKDLIVAFLAGEIRYDQHTVQGVADHFKIRFAAASDLLSEMEKDGAVYTMNYRFWV